MMDANQHQPDISTVDSAPPAVTPVAAFTETWKRERNASVERIISIGILLLALVFMLYVMSPTLKVAQQEYAPMERVQLTSEQTPQKRFPQVTLQAKAAYVYDIANNKSLYTKNADAQLPLASITKLMTVLVAADIFKNEGLIAFANDDDTSITGNPFPSTRWIPHDVFTYTLIQSSNLGASTIAAAAGAVARTVSDRENAEDIFIEYMNAKAEELGMTQTYFVNETGLDATESVGGGYGSARDSAILLAKLAETHMPVLEQTRLPAVEFEATDHSKMVAINTNTALRKIPGLMGSKTGYTKLAGGNLAVLFDAGLGRPIVIVALGSTEEGRFSDVVKLVNATIEYLSETDISP